MEECQDHDDEALMIMMITILMVMVTAMMTIMMTTMMMSRRMVMMMTMSVMVMIATVMVMMEMTLIIIPRPKSERVENHANKREEIDSQCGCLVPVGSETRHHITFANLFYNHIIVKAN